MKAKKEIIDRAVKNGSMDRVNCLLSAAHVVLCVANNLYSEAGEVLADNGMMAGLLFRKHNLYHKAADAYFKEFASMVMTDETKMELFGDMEKVEKGIREWAFSSQKTE